MLYFPIACKILDVGNPRRAVQQLSVNMGLNMALPCRISVCRDGGDEIRHDPPHRALGALPGVG